ncbi:MAG: SPFH domain-containing protein [Planctomycetota bacterium]
MISDAWDTIRAWFLSDVIGDFIRDNLWALWLVVWAIIRATGKIVQTGQTGLLFSFGRAKKVIGPGFRALIPFLQIVRIVPTRHRTLHLPAQCVTTRDGLVYFVDANLVFQVVDIRKALVEIDDLVKGMSQALGLGVQAVLVERGRAEMRAGGELDALLAKDLGRRLEPWGVEVVRAGFITITPSPESLRVTQIAAQVEEREKAFGAFEAAGLSRGQALALLGTRTRLTNRGRAVREKESRRRARRRLDRRMLQAGFRLVKPKREKKAVA